MNLYSEEIIKPYSLGLHYGIPDEKYHEIKAVSNSYLKYSNKSMKHFMAALKGAQKEATPAMIKGGLLHLAILQPSVFKKNTYISDATTKAQKQYKQDVEDYPFCHVLLKTEADEITGMANALIEDPVIKPIITGIKTEVTMFAKDPVTGLVMKGRTDIEGSKSYIADYKTTENAKPEVFAKSAANYWYHVQAAHYMEMYKILGQPKDYFIIIAQEKSEPYESCSFVWKHDGPEIEKGLEIRRKLLDKIHGNLQANNITGYASSIIELHLPEWAYREEV